MDAKELLGILITMIEARKARAEGFMINQDMYTEVRLCEAMISALKKMQDSEEDKKDKPDPENRGWDPYIA